MNKLKFPLPRDIDLTEDEVFGRNWINMLSTRLHSDLLPWEGDPLTKLDSFITNSRFISSFELASGETVDFNLDNDDLWMTWSGNTVNRSSTSSSINTTTTLSRNTSSTVLRINETISSIIDTVSGLQKYKKIKCWYLNDSDDYDSPIKSLDYLEYLDLYKNLPFSPEFKGTKEVNIFRYNECNKLDDLKNLSFNDKFYCHNSDRITEKDIDSLKYGDGKYVNGYGKYNANVWYDRTPGALLADVPGGDYKRISIYNWKEDEDYFIGKELLPWEERRGFR